MAAQPEDAGPWPPVLARDLCLTVPGAARVYDFMPGDEDSLAVDRRLVDQMIKAVPDALTGPRAMRACPRRAVRHVVSWRPEVSRGGGPSSSYQALIGGRK